MCLSKHNYGLACAQAIASHNLFYGCYSGEAKTRCIR